MQGEIGVESRTGRRFYFLVYARFEKQAAKPRRTDDRDLAAVRVLVVDDNATNREILCQQILAWKMQAASAATGPEALQKLRTAVQEGHPYDLAFWMSRCLEWMD